MRHVRGGSRLAVVLCDRRSHISRHRQRPPWRGTVAQPSLNPRQRPIEAAAHDAQEIAHGVKSAALYRMVSDQHMCPFGLKSLDLLRREDYDVEDDLLHSRAEIDAFKAEFDVETTPQTFIGGQR